MFYKKLLLTTLVFIFISPFGIAADTLLFLNVKDAERIQSAVKSESKELKIFVGRLRMHAEHQMDRGPWSVTDHPSPAASGNSHDFFSEGPYWWPDPKNPDGPYIRRDGEVNPDRFTWHDDNLSRLSEAVLTLGMAGCFLDEPKFIDRAEELLTFWFLDEKTKMNPHLEYGQAIKGRTTGRGIGLIDTRSLIYIAQGVMFMDQAGWNREKKHQLQEWYGDFLHWMTHNEKGLDEKRHGNNHSTWWGAQVAAYSILLKTMNSKNRFGNFIKIF